MLQAIIESDLSNNVVSVCGVLLNKLDINDTVTCNNDPKLVTQKEKLTVVSSTEANLRRLALAVAADQPVLLVGPVGSGKTTLVEHLAAVTGRIKAPHLMKIQLGDQTDSKVG